MMVCIMLTIILISIGRIPLWALDLPSGVKNVKLISENLHYTLTWESDSLQDCTNYEAVIRSRKSYSSNWTEMNLICKKINFSCQCDLSQYMNNSENDIYDIFWAKVRFVNSTTVSNWSAESQLNPFKDSILGPPIVFSSLQNYSLIVTISMPLTSYCQGGTCLAVQEVLKYIKYSIILLEDNRKIHDVFQSSGGNTINYTFDEPLKPSCNYCLIVGVKNQSNSFKKCFTTPSDNTGVYLIIIITFYAIIVLLLICVGSSYFAMSYVYLGSSKMQLPKTLAIINEEITVNLCTLNDIDFECDSISIVSMTTSVLEEYSDTKQELSKTELIPQNYNSQQDDSYHNNGFGPGYDDNDVYSPSFFSWSSRKMDCTGTVDTLSLGQMKENYSDNQCYSVAPAIHPPTCPQVYLEHNLLVPDSEKPTVTWSTSSHYQEKIKEGLPCDRAERLLRYQIAIPLNSVKFQDGEEEFISILEDFYDPTIDNVLEKNCPNTSSADSVSLYKPQVKTKVSAGLDVMVHECDTLLKTQDAQLFSFSGYELRDVPLPICTDHGTSSS